MTVDYLIERPNNEKEIENIIKSLERIPKEDIISFIKEELSKK